MMVRTYEWIFCLEIPSLIYTVFGFGGKGVEYANLLWMVKPFIDKEYHPLRSSAQLWLDHHNWNITQFAGLDYKGTIGCLGSFLQTNWLHQDAFDVIASKARADQRVYVYVGTEEADDTDGAMAEQQAGLLTLYWAITMIWSLVGVDLESIKIHSIWRWTQWSLGRGIYQTVFAFSRKVGLVFY